jgi:hypothetical protein
MEPGIGWLERTVNMIKKYGIWKVIQGLVVVCSFVYIIYNIANLDKIFKSAFTERATFAQQQHDKAVEYRNEIKPEISRILKNAIVQSGSDRAFIVEMHNGTNNTAGLPFIYGEMTYEEVREGYSHVGDGYLSMNLSRYDFPLYIEKNKMWCGTSEELIKVDDKFAHRVMADGVTYIGMIAINGYYNELGLFGLTYCDGHVPPEGVDLEKLLISDVQKLSMLLDTYDKDEIKK